MTKSPPTSDRRDRVLLALRSYPNKVALEQVLMSESVSCVEATNHTALSAIGRDIDLMVMSEAALVNESAMVHIADALLSQPEWSNVSTILLLKGTRRSPNFRTFWSIVGHHRSVILLQTPLKVNVFTSIVRACLQDRKRQYALKSVLDELEESNRTLEGFSYTAAHELRNPLGILNSSFGILDRTELTQKQAQFVEMGLRTVRSMDQTLQALLDYGKLKADRESFQTVNMNVIAAQSVDGLQKLIETKSAQVRWESLPKVSGNPQLLIQLLSNLLKNAIVHNAKPAPEVSIRSNLKGNRWTLHIVDNGPGISADNQQRIFSLFDRAGKSRTDGSGIGLALCWRIVEQHGGEINVHSEEGKGSDFYFDLKAAE